jgi:hypothetical protein
MDAQVLPIARRKLGLSATQCAIIAVTFPAGWISP